MFILINGLIGLDTLAIAKRGESQLDGAFKVPKERTISIAATAEDEDKSESSIVVDDSEHGGHAGTRRHANRRYRESTSESSHAGIFLLDFFSVCKYVTTICVYV